MGEYKESGSSGERGSGGSDSNRSGTRTAVDEVYDRPGRREQISDTMDGGRESARRKIEKNY